MKRRLVQLALAIVAVLSMASVSPVHVDALDCSKDPDRGSAACNPENQNNPCVNPEVAKSALCESTRNNQDPINGPDGILTRAVELMSYLVGIASIVVVIVGAIRFTTSSGDANGISAAKKMIVYALIGIVVAIFAQALVILVLK